MNIFKKYYNAISLKVSYKMDAVAKVVRVNLNKPEKYRTENEKDKIENIVIHFSDLGYLVIVED